MRKCVLVYSILLCCCTLIAMTFTRQDSPEKYKWNLSQIYKNIAEWKRAKEDIANKILVFDSYKGHLGDSSQKLYEALKFCSDVDKELSRLLSYANMLHDEDTRIAKNQELLQEGETLATKYGAAVSFLNPELLYLDRTKVDNFKREQPKLQEFSMFLDNVMRMKEHTLSHNEEKILAKTFGEMGGSAEAFYSIMVNSELPFPEINLSTGEKVKLSNAAYTKYRTLPNRTDRELVFREFWGAYKKFNLTYGTSLYYQLKAHVCSKDLRKYNSCLEAALDGSNIPTAVYTQLIASVHLNIATLHRYLKLRQKMMGVENLRYEDLYASIIPNVGLKYTADDAMKLVLEAVTPLGINYVTALKNGFEARWCDFYSGPGKKSGAYSNGSVYDVHPYQLLNFNGTYEDVSTLAHESGHSMHSYLSNKNQPYVNSSYSIFVAEVASTCNENLLLNYILQHTQDDNVKLFLLGSVLDDLRTTIFRQTLFAEFELKIHEIVESGKPLSGESLNKIYLDLVRNYYGHHQGICYVDDLYANEWAYVHHFYRNFYVYQYATSKVASLYISKKILEEHSKKTSTKTRNAYIRMLSSGSSKYPIDLLKEAGVNMTTSTPFKAAIAEMNEIMDQIEMIQKKLEYKK